MGLNRISVPTISENLEGAVFHSHLNLLPFQLNAVFQHLCAIEPDQRLFALYSEHFARQWPGESGSSESEIVLALCQSMCSLFVVSELQREASSLQRKCYE